MLPWGSRALVPSAYRLMPSKARAVLVAGSGVASAQVKVLGDTLSVTGPQVLLLPLFTCAAVTLALPLAFRVTLTFWSLAVNTHELYACPTSGANNASSTRTGRHWARQEVEESMRLFIRNGNE